MAFEKLNFGKTDIQEKIIIWGKWISGNWNWGKQTFGGKKFGKMDFGRLDLGSWVVTILEYQPNYYHTSGYKLQELYFVIEYERVFLVQKNLNKPSDRFTFRNVLLRSFEKRDWFSLLFQKSIWTKQERQLFYCLRGSTLSRF